MRKPRLYRQDGSIYVIGTADLPTALRLADLSTTTHRWGSTVFGLFARRRGKWRSISDYMPPQDAVPGVAFLGPILITTPMETP